MGWGRVVGVVVGCGGWVWWWGGVVWLVDGGGQEKLGIKLTIAEAVGCLDNLYKI